MWELKRSPGAPGKLGKREGGRVQAGHLQTGREGGGGRGREGKRRASQVQVQGSSLVPHSVMGVGVSYEGPSPPPLWPGAGVVASKAQGQNPGGLCIFPRARGPRAGLGGSDTAQDLVALRVAWSHPDLPLANLVGISSISASRLLVTLCSCFYPDYTKQNKTV